MSPSQGGVDGPPATALRRAPATLEVALRDVVAPKRFDARTTLKLPEDRLEELSAEHQTMKADHLSLEQLRGAHTALVAELEEAEREPSVASARVTPKSSPRTTHSTRVPSASARRGFWC